MRNNMCVSLTLACCLVAMWPEGPCSDPNPQVAAKLSVPLWMCKSGTSEKQQPVSSLRHSPISLSPFETGNKQSQQTEKGLLLLHQQCLHPQKLMSTKPFLCLD